jgi:hypothetical protein
MANPSCTIDFSRDFSLPFGVPEDEVVGADLARYEAELGAKLEFLDLAWNAALPFMSHEQPRDPFTPVLRVRFLNNSASAGSVLIPTPLSPGIVAAADMGTINFSLGQLDVVGRKPPWKGVTPQPGEPMSAAMARTFRWDEDERRLWAGPQPYVADEALALYWPSGGPAPAGPLGVDAPGIFADDNSAYLLKTSAAARDGELQSDLLRTPVRGLVRVTRYRHIGVTVAGGHISAPASAVRAQSSACAVVILVPPGSITVPADLNGPLYSKNYIIWDQVQISEASSCLAGLWWLQLLRFAELEAIAKLKEGLHSSLAWAFGIYLALSTVYPLVPLPGDALAGFDPAAANKLRSPKARPDQAALKAAVGYVLADANRRSAFLWFIRNIMGPLACGVSWTELGYPGVPAPPNARAPHTEAHQVLERAQQAPEIWIAAYAGAPVGRPALQYGGPPGGPPIAVSFVVRNGFTTFDLEAFVITGRADAAFPAVNPPAPPTAPDQVVKLDDYAGVSSGRFACLRTADTQPGSIAYTMRDWLRDLVVGWTRGGAPVPFPLDFSTLAGAGHPLAAGLAWDRVQKARALRDSLDEAAAAVDPAGHPLDMAALDWWIGAVRFDGGAMWPDDFHPPTAAAGPQEPSRTAATRPDSAAMPLPSGFDVVDIDLALEAMEHLRSGADLTKPVDLALVLALLLREGYALAGRYMRQGPFDGIVRDNFHGALVKKGSFLPDSLMQRGAFQGIGRKFYMLQAMGLDVVDGRSTTPIGMVPNWLRFAWDNLFTHITNATMQGTVVGLNTLALEGKMLTRISSGFESGTLTGQSVLRSRRVHLAGMIAQQGEFQRRHVLSRAGSGAGGLDRHWQAGGRVVLEDVPEFTATAAPTPGMNAEDLARAAYLSYYAVCYLAFNASPTVWNSWMKLAKTLAAAAGRTASNFFLYPPPMIHDADWTSGAVVPNPVVDIDTGRRARELIDRAKCARFAVGLDAYLRMRDTGHGDVAPPVRGGWPP